MVARMEFTISFDENGINTSRRLHGTKTVEGREGVAEYLREIADVLEVCEAGWPFEITITPAVLAEKPVETGLLSATSAGGRQVPRR